MRVLTVLLFALTFCTTAHASDMPDAEPVHHFKLADLTSMADAKKVFIETTTEIKGKQKLDAEELHEIHIITYSLEKSVEFFTQNLTGDKQELAEEIAVLVEKIHLNSETNRTEETREYLKAYFELADQFIAEFS